ncbi:MAG: hypothetical protein M3124_00495 [Actinomycetota bacterium]|nr:hypothetical protein [Actinomycetota bacterium]
MYRSRSSRWSLFRCVLLLAAVLACSSCGGDSGANGGGGRDEITGPVVKVDAKSLGEVTSIELKQGDETYEILIDPEIDYDYNLGHISEHLSSGAPLRVEVEERDGELFATSISDADGDH